MMFITFYQNVNKNIRKCGKKLEKIAKFFKISKKLRFFKISKKLLFFQNFEKVALFLKNPEMMTAKHYAGQRCRRLTASITRARRRRLCSRR